MPVHVTDLMGQHAKRRCNGVDLHVVNRSLFITLARVTMEHEVIADEIGEDGSIAVLIHLGVFTSLIHLTHNNH